MTRLHRIPATLVGAVALCVGGCDTTPSSNTTTSASSKPISPQPNPATLRTPASSTQKIKTVPMVPGMPLPVASVDANVNPRKLPPYAGPTGGVEGTIKMRGDRPESVALDLPPACEGARPTYEKSYREGPARTVADVMVAITGYDAYVPAKGEAARVIIDQCAFSTRTVVATFGQRVEVSNIDAKNSFVPVLLGAPSTSMMVAVPNGDPVRLYPLHVGQYVLADNMDRAWMRADVIVLKYATHAVTGLDGHYRIEGIPVGEVDVDAFLPSIDVTAGRKKVTITEGQTTKVDLVLESTKKAEPPAVSASASGPKVPPVK
jgi:hypothetical protein